jgi:molybdenum cofactor cytidylyltransferase
MFTSAILLAAGSAARMGADKLLLPYKGRRLIDFALTPLLDCALVDEVVLVVRPDLDPALDHPKCRIVANHDHREGLGSSLRAGVRAVNPAADAYLVSLADMPGVTVDLVATLIDAFRQCGKPIIVPVYQQRHGHPVIFNRACRDELLRLGGDLGARQLIAEHADWVEYFPTQDHAVVYDVDTPEDLMAGGPPLG